MGSVARGKPELLLALSSLKEAIDSDKETFDKALDWCRTASDDIHYAHALYREISEIAISKKLWITAEEFAIKTLQKMPNSGAALRILGNSLRGQNRLAEAAICHRYGFPSTLREKYFSDSPHTSINSEQSQGTEQLPAFEGSTTPLRQAIMLNKTAVKELSQTSLNSSSAHCFVLSESKLWFDGFNAITWDRNGHVITDVTRGFPDIVQSALGERIPRKLAGTSCLLGNRNSHNYYHWMNDILPRLHILQKIGIELDSIKHFVVNPLEHDFQFETLHRFGIDQSRLCVVDAENYYHCEELLVPVYGSNSLGKRQAAWTLKFLKSSFLSHQQPEHSQRLYISRKNANGRSITNEDQLMEWLSSKGFVHVCLEGMTVKEQAQLFDTAKVVLGSHGAGLTNTVFCKPGTTIIELYKDHIAPCFWINSELTSLRHAIHYCGKQEHRTTTDERYHGTAEQRRLSDFSVNIDSLEQLLIKLDIS